MINFRLSIPESLINKKLLIGEWVDTKPDWSETNGYICWGENEKNKHSKGGGYGFLSAETVESLSEGDWIEFMFILKNKLNKHEIEVLKKRYVRQVLDFDTKIPALLNTIPSRLALTHCTLKIL